MNKGFLLVLMFGFSLCCRPECVFGTDSLVIDADRQFNFAQAYFEGEEYYRAITEYDRFIHFFPDDARVVLARYRIGVSYLKGKQYRKALETFQRLTETGVKPDILVKAYLKMAECYERLGEPDNAVSTLKTLRELRDETDVRDETFYRQGWLLLEMSEWASARDAFSKISPTNHDRYRLTELSEDLDKQGALKTKNPSLAGGLAIVPGAGHLYCGRPQEALMAFALNGAMIWAAYEAFENDNDVLGGVITFFEVGLYSGNIYSAVNCAHKHNRAQRRGFLEYLRQHSVLKASLGQGVALSYSLTF